MVLSNRPYFLWIYRAISTWDVARTREKLVVKHKPLGDLVIYQVFGFTWFSEFSSSRVEPSIRQKPYVYRYIRTYDLQLCRPIGARVVSLLLYN